MDSGKEKMRITPRLVAMMLLVPAAIVGIFAAMASPWMSLTPFDKDIMNFYLNYELSILPISFVMLAGTWAIGHPHTACVLQLHTKGRAGCAGPFAGRDQA